MTTGIVPHKEILFDQASGDYALYLDDTLIGYARTYHEGAIVLDAVAAEQESALDADQIVRPGDWVELTASSGRGEAWREAHVLDTSGDTLTVGYGSRGLDRDLWRIGRGLGSFTVKRGEVEAIWRHYTTDISAAWGVSGCTHRLARPIEAV